MVFQLFMKAGKKSAATTWVMIHRKVKYADTLVNRQATVLGSAGYYRIIEDSFKTYRRLPSYRTVVCLLERIVAPRPRNGSEISYSHL